MKRLMFALALVAALFTGAADAGVKYVAVVESEVDAQSGAAAKINKAEVRQITAALRREAVNNLPRGKYNIMTAETVQAQSGSVLEECAEENCVITLGSKIGADYIVRGLISKVGAKLTVTVEMYETEDGTLVASSDMALADNASGLLEKAAAACAKMYQKFESEATAIAAQKAAAQQTAATATQTAPLLSPPPPPPAPPQPVAAAPVPTYQQSNGGGFGTFTDGRDGKRYKTVVIGGKRWMAENLNYPPQSGQSWCYNNDNSNCDKYGRLYDWNTARTVCPGGWHLPSRQEWNDLVTAAGGSSVAGKNLKARSGWSGNGNGTDAYGFSALPGGSRGSDGTFSYAGSYGYWWTATERSGEYAYIRYMGYYDDLVGESSYYKSYGFAVRCLAD